MTDQFEKKAKDWDAVPWKQTLAEEAYQAIRSRIDFNADDRLMDFGGGTGLLTLKFQDDVSSMTVVDTSQSMLGVLRDKIEAQNLEQVKIVDQLLVPGSLPDESCEIIISMMTLHHIEDLTALFKIFADILVPGGKVALVDLAKEDGDFHPVEAKYVHDGFEPQTLIDHLHAAGFESVHIESFASVSKTTAAGIDKEYPMLLVTGVKASH